MKTFRRTVLSMALAAALSPLAYAQPTVVLSIDSQPMADALAELAQQTGLQLIVASEAAKDLTSPSITGEFTAESALTRLLAGTGLDYQFINKRTIAIRSAKKAMTEISFREGSEVPVRLAQESSSEYQSQASLDDASVGSIEELAEVIVTGSRIKRKREEAGASVVTFERKDIDRIGAGTVNDVIRYLPQATFVNDESGWNTLGGRTSINLRGLGAGMTLVLLNGRRMPASSATGGDFVDLGSIPLGMVERVEILAEGASAVYGSDAMGGVMNIILRKDVQGLQLQGRHGHISKSDEQSISVGYGGSVGAFSGTIFADFYERDGLWQRDRKRTSLPDTTHMGGRDLRSTYAAHPGNVYSLDGEPLPGLTSTFAGIPQGDGIGLTAADFAANDGVLNRARLDGGHLQPETQRQSVTATFEYDSNQSIQAFGEASWMEVETLQAAGSNVLAAGSIGWFSVAANNPFNPFGETVGIDYNFSELGDVTYAMESTATRILVGLRGNIGGSWDWELATSRFGDKGALLVLNEMDADRVRAALNETDSALALNVFSSGPAGSPELLRSLVANGRTWIRSDGEQLLIDGFIRGPLFGGKAQLLLGAEYRREDLEYATSASYIGGDRDVQSYYAELAVPLIRREMGLWLDNLALTAAGRYDRYSDFGDTFNPQVSVSMRPNSSVGLRLAWSSSFKAPMLKELYSPQWRSTTIGPDPARGEQAVYSSINGGNPDLDAEEGESISIGLELTPQALPGFSAHIAYWALTLDRLIGVVDVLAAEERFASRVVRAAPTPDDIAAGRPGRLLTVDASSINVGLLEVNGIDVKASYTFGTPVGWFTPTLAATYVDSYKVAIMPGEPLIETVGIGAGLGYAQPTIVRWKGNVGVSWERNALQFGVFGRYIDSYRDAGVWGDGRGDRDVKNQFLIDLHGGYTFDSLNLRISGGVANLFDDEPPFSNIGGSLGYDPSQGDVRGRALHLQINKTF